VKILRPGVMYVKLALIRVQMIKCCHV